MHHLAPTRMGEGALHAVMLAALAAHAHWGAPHPRPIMVGEVRGLLRPGSLSSSPARPWTPLLHQHHWHSSRAKLRAAALAAALLLLVGVVLGPARCGCSSTAIQAPVLEPEPKHFEPKPYTQAQECSGLDLDDSYAIPGCLAVSQASRRRWLLPLSNVAAATCARWGRAPGSWPRGCAGCLHEHRVLLLLLLFLHLRRRAWTRGRSS